VLVTRSRTIVAALAALICAPAGADAATVSSISMYSDPGEFVGQGAQRVYHAGNSTAIDASQRHGVLTAGADGGTRGDSFSFHFRGPDGRLPQPGVYVGAERLGFERPGHPAMDVEGMSRGCEDLGGGFEVRDLDLNAAGDVDRLWLIYHQHCAGRPEQTWGEIRIGAWVPHDQAAVAPGLVRWPPLDAWRRATPVPVTYLGDAPVASVTLGGSHPKDFAIDADGCTGRAGACDVSVRFVPTAAGVRRALLRFTDARGRVRDSVLEGFAHGGVTRAEFDVTEGDVAATPGRYAYDATNAQFGGGGSDAVLRLILFGADRNAWQAEFSVTSGALQRGTTYVAESTRGPTPYLDVYGSARGCQPNGGDFTVHELRWLPDGALRSADVSFVEDCYPDRRPALIGRWRYRAGAAEALADWLVPGGRAGVDGPWLSKLRRACPDRVELVARRMTGSDRANRLRGGTGPDLIRARGGGDSVAARRGRDCVSGGRGRDRLAGGRGRDVLLGQGGADVLVGGPGPDVLDCGSGRRDVAYVTAGDRPRRCERVRRD
jgi:hypothetical protein